MAGEHPSEQLCFQAAQSVSYLWKQMEAHGTCEAFISCLLFSLFFMSIVCLFPLSDSQVPLELPHVFALLWLFHFSHILIELTHQQIVLSGIFLMSLLLLPYENSPRFLAPRCSQCHSCCQTQSLGKCLISEPLLELVSFCPSHTDTSHSSGLSVGNHCWTHSTMPRAATSSVQHYFAPKIRAAP